MNRNYIFTSEAVTEGHPDKVADQISDAVLDAIIEKDSEARVACETFVTTGMAFIGGEITTDSFVQIPDIVRKTIKEIGYNNSQCGFDGDTCAVITSIDEQSPDIARGVNGSNDIGAGDQGFMFGYACDETSQLMPLPITLAQKLAKRLAEVRKNRIISYLRPDGKTQVSVEYQNNRPVRIDKVLVSAQHQPDIELSRIKEDIIDKVIKEVIDDNFLDNNTDYLINPTGRFVRGGPNADAGLTGRKIIVDTYGGMSRHGGGAFSGKDPTKVDRSASYAARYVAKNIVAAELAERCEVQISYAIGVAKPFSILINTYNTGKISDEKLGKLVESSFDLRPGSIIENFNLLRPIYNSVAVYGHFGRADLDLPWERTDKKEILIKQLNS